MDFTLIPAGAGPGKTHRIQEELIQRIKNGLDPEKVVAVTFTEAAAAELRGRIRTALVKEGMLDQAIRLDQAYISTIHGFGKAAQLKEKFSTEGNFFYGTLEEDTDTEFFPSLFPDAALIMLSVTNPKDPTRSIMNDERQLELPTDDNYNSRKLRAL